MIKDNLAHQRIDKVEETLNNHYEMITSLKGALDENTSCLHENTRITQDIANNTSEIVSIIRGVKGFRKLIMFLSPIIIAVMGAIAYIKGMK